MTDEYLWPARNVAEYAYCPRLFYLMEVEGVYLPSADTEQGLGVHRRVDRASVAAASGEDPERPKSVRSLTLTSPRLSLTATLDLAEITGKTAIPVEYRKGRPKRVQGDPANGDGAASAARYEPWPTDRVQVGLQSILLEEAGYSVPQAVLYYAAEKRKLLVPVDASLRAEALAVLEAAKACARGERPQPLVNDPRCVGCSLQPICLPDEVNFERAGEADPELVPRNVWPPRDDGILVAIQQNGTRVGVRGLSLRVSTKEGGLIQEVPLTTVESLALVGSVQISTQAVHVLADRGIPVAYLSGAGRLIAMVDPLDSVSAQVRRAQMRRLDQEGPPLELARAVVAAKITNQRTLLLRNCANLPSSVAADLKIEAERAAVASSVESLRGHEGQAAALYFGHFAGMLKGDLAAEFDANGRQRRPPPDPVNACLSFAYSLLTHECVAALRLARLEPSIGAYHVSRPGRPAFALDLMEPFRPLIADSLALTAFNRGELTEGHFLRAAAGCALTRSGRAAFFAAYARRMDAEVTHPVYGYRLSYRRMLMLHARLIAAWLLGEVPSLAFLTTR